MPAWLEGDFAGIADLLVSAESKGFDRLDMPDHLLMSENIEVYPYAKVPPAAYRAHFYEPLTILAALAAVTSRIRLATGILIAPLRPAVLLAKQAATMDMISGGRLDLGLGVGWQKEEYDACGVPWEGRFGYMDEQVKACRALWQNAPAHFAGKHVNFDTVYALPFPLQKPGIPIWYGVAPTARNFARMAEMDAGWMPSPKEDNPEQLAEHVKNLRNAFARSGRDPATVKVQAKPRTRHHPDGTPDVAATLAQYAAFAQAGATTIYVTAHYLCADPKDYETILDRVIAVRQAIR
jgi:probable F420-dependent oxidoreductase